MSETEKTQLGSQANLKLPNLKPTRDLCEVSGRGGVWKQGRVIAFSKGCKKMTEKEGGSQGAKVYRGNTRFKWIRLNLSVSFFLVVKAVIIPLH